MYIGKKTNKKKGLKFIFLFLLTFGTIQADVVKVTGNGVNIRSGPGTNYRVVHSSRKGDMLERIKNSGRWVKVRLSSGRNGWIAKGYTFRIKNFEVKRGCLNSEIAGGIGGLAGAALYTKYAVDTVCCGATAGWGCVACIAVTTSIAGATARYFTKENSKEILCD